jgi:hypothetical protein
MVTPSARQISLMDDLIRGDKRPDHIHGKSLAALKKHGWVDEKGLVTQEGLKHVSVPTVEVDVITFGSDVHYTHRYWVDKEKKITGNIPLNFPKGTEMIVTFVFPDKKYRAVYEGMINVNGSPVWVRLYHSPHFTRVKRLMPMKE